MNLSSKLQDIRWDLYSLEDEISEIERENEELLNELDEVKNTFDVESVYDEMKLKFVKEIWEKYSLEDLEKIFEFEPGKGIQLKLK
jgi:predicted RNase H-like nuclease (RuvC/YqgF family)